MTKFLHGVVHTFGAMLGGVYLIALYGFSIWVSVGALTAIQVRAELEAQDQAFSFDNVDRARNKLDAAISRINDNLAKQDPVNATWYDMGQKLAELQYLIGPSEGTFDVWNYRYTPEYTSNKIDCDLDPEAVEPKEICPMIEDYEVLGLNLESLQQLGQNNPAEMAAIAAAAQIEKLQSDEPLFRYFGQYEFFNNWKYRTFLHVPGEVLVLLLTLFMGLLGSVVTMTWLFIRQDSGLTLRRFIILPFIGSMSAFIILIFLSAGQLTLTAGDANAQLDPFVLSFVGIISGLLSERAYTRIAEVGSNFFKVDDGQPRWALNLKDAMAATGVTAAELAVHLGATEEEAGRIVSESTTATLPQQRLIAATLRRPVRELFTDVPPDGPTAKAAGQAGQTVAVPDLVGLDGAAMLAALHAAGLELGATSEAPDDAAPLGAVLLQDPAPGTRAPKGGRVDVTVAAAGGGSPSADGQVLG